MARVKLDIFRVCMFLLAASCVSPEIANAQTNEEREKQCAARVDSLFPSRVGVRVKRAEMHRDCARSVYGQDPYREEYWAYFIYMASEVDAGRISLEQANYQITQKENELLAKRNAQLMQILPYVNQQQQPPNRPVVPPVQIPPTYNTNCTRDMFGNTNCTTRQQ